MTEGDFQTKIIERLSDVMSEYKNYLIENNRIYDQLDILNPLWHNDSKFEISYKSEIIKGISSSKQAFTPIEELKGFLKDYTNLSKTSCEKKFSR
jgi:hypothetical protein